MVVNTIILVCVERNEDLGRLYGKPKLKLLQPVKGWSPPNTHLFNNSEYFEKIPHLIWRHLFDACIHPELQSWVSFWFLHLPWYDLVVECSWVFFRSKEIDDPLHQHRKGRFLSGVTHSNVHTKYAGSTLILNVLKVIFEKHKWWGRIGV